MEFEFNPHAPGRMRRRQVPEDAVYAIVADYDDRLDRDDDATEYRGSWEGRDVLVVLRWLNEEERRAEIITVVELNTRRKRRR